MLVPEAVDRGVDLQVRLLRMVVVHAVERAELDLKKRKEVKHCWVNKELLMDEQLHFLRGFEVRAPVFPAYSRAHK